MKKYKKMKEESKCLPMQVYMRNIKGYLKNIEKYNLNMKYLIPKITDSIKWEHIPKLKLKTT